MKGMKGMSMLTRHAQTGQARGFETSCQKSSKIFGGAR
jgi:hypothetical protein